MAECAYCNGETEMFCRSVPICLECAIIQQDKRELEFQRSILADLLHNLGQAIRHANCASSEFKAVCRYKANNFPRRDGTRLVWNAALKLHSAREAMMDAKIRLSDFLDRGAVRGEHKGMD